MNSGYQAASGEKSDDVGAQDLETVITAFFQLTEPEKLLFAKVHARDNYSGVLGQDRVRKASLLQLLLYTNVRVLNSKCKWLDELMAAETYREHYTGILKALTVRPQLSALDTLGENFQRLFHLWKNHADSTGRTALMEVCQCNATIFSKNLPWVDELLLLHSGRKDEEGITALKLALQNPKLELDAPQVMWLVRAEIELQPDALRLLCAHNPAALNRSSPAISLLLQQAGYTDSHGDCALSLLLSSSRAHEVVFSGD